MNSEFTKSYYKIKDVSEMLGVPESTLRYWEKTFSGLEPVRTSSNRRAYRPQDVEYLKIIHYLLKTRGLKIDSAKELLRNNKKNITQRLEIIGRLNHIKGELQQILNGLDKIRANEQ